MVAANAATIYPNRVTVQGKTGTKASLQFKVYGHPESVEVEFVKTNDLKSSDDKVLQTFQLGKEAQYVVPIDISISESKNFYLCAVLKKSQSMRLRVCSAVSVIASQ
jgi:hypothetical protein